MHIAAKGRHQHTRHWVASWVALTALLALLAQPEVIGGIAPVVAASLPGAVKGAGEPPSGPRQPRSKLQQDDSLDRATILRLARATASANGLNIQPTTGAAVPPCILATFSQPTPPPSPTARSLFVGDAKTIQKLWARQGSYTCTNGTSVESPTQAFLDWVDRFAQAPSAPTDAENSRWIHQEVTYRFWVFRGKPGAAPPNPGPVPPSLLQTSGPLPAVVFVRVPRKLSVVSFRAGAVTRSASYSDHVLANLDDWNRVIYFYKHADGVSDGGNIALGDLTQAQWLPVVLSLNRRYGAEPNAVHIGPSTERVLSDVSAKEGGFDALNTFDPGSISLGCIQFALTGTLAQMLSNFKTQAPDVFQQLFHRYGIDIKGPGQEDLVVVSPSTGAIVEGTDAVRAIIADKRLSAVLQWAGSNVDFQSAQVHLALRSYDPWVHTDTDPFAFRPGVIYQGPGTTNIVRWSTNQDLDSAQAAVDAHNAHVSHPAELWHLPVSPLLSLSLRQLLSSEAARAALLDIWVQHGNIEELKPALVGILNSYHLRSVNEIGGYQAALLPLLSPRQGVLSYPGLQQPAAPLTLAPQASVAQVNLSGPGASQRFTLSAHGNAGPRTWWALTSTDTGSGWLSLTPGSGTLNTAGAGQSLLVQVHPAGLKAGTYTGSLTLLADGAADPAVVVSVTLHL